MSHFCKSNTYTFCIYTYIHTHTNVGFLRRNYKGNTKISSECLFAFTSYNVPVFYLLMYFKKDSLILTGICNV